MSDEAWFHVSGNVNAHNSRIWDTENPHVLHQRPLHDIKVGVWCAVSTRRVIGPIFFGDTVNSDRYVSDILEPFFQELTGTNRRHDMAIFNKIAQRHTRHAILCSVGETCLMMNKLSAKAYGRLAPLDFYLWGNLKGKVYKNNPLTADALKSEIRNIVRSINGDERQRVFRNLMTRCET
jgi:hypothetical protein